MNSFDLEYKGPIIRYGIVQTLELVGEAVLLFPAENNGVNNFYGSRQTTRASLLFPFFAFGKVTFTLE